MGFNDEIHKLMGQAKGMPKDPVRSSAGAPPTRTARMKAVQAVKSKDSSWTTLGKVDRSAPIRLVKKTFRSRVLSLVLRYLIDEIEIRSLHNWNIVI
jgi:hypothetical protein